MKQSNFTFSELTCIKVLPWAVRLQKVPIKSELYGSHEILCLALIEDGMFLAQKAHIQKEEFMVLTSGGWCGWSGCRLSSECPPFVGIRSLNSHPAEVNNGWVNACCVAWLFLAELWVKRKICLVNKGHTEVPTWHFGLYISHQKTHNYFTVQLFVHPRYRPSVKSTGYHTDICEKNKNSDFLLNWTFFLRIECINDMAYIVV